MAAKSQLLGMALLAAALAASPAPAQLRPAAPLDWDLFDHPRALNVGVGLGLFSDQPASLAGTRGTLYELGNFRIAWRSGRIGVEFAGTLHRRFVDQVVIRPPAPGAQPADGQIRRDAGDLLAFTAVRMSGGANPLALAIRFGTRLPTSSDEAGLERDRTDFFSSLGARYRLGPLLLDAEAGVGILGTRLADLDQLDVLIYAAGMAWRAGPLTASASILGQDDVHDRVIRGNEDLSELRFSLRGGDRTWVSLTAIHGIAEFSPRHGLQLMAGFRR